MSLMDQAFIKAYAKESPVATLPPRTVAAASAATRANGAAAAGQKAATTIDDVYAYGTLYRLDSPAADDTATRVPAPHYGIKTPAPSRRTHRGVLDRLAELTEGSSPSGRSSRRGPMRPSTDLPAQNVPATSVPASSVAAPMVPTPAADQAPEIIFHEPPAAPKEVAAPPAKPAPLAPDSLNLGPTTAYLHVDWQAATSAEFAAQSQVVLPNPFDFEHAAAEALLRIELEPLPEPIPEPIPQKSAAEISSAKKFRVDAAHTAAVPAPHHREVLPEQEPAQEVEEACPPVPSPGPLSLPFTAPASEPEPEYELAAAAVVQDETSPIGEQPKKPCVPLWEVDRFVWPETCDKLLRDDQSYFAQAGTKLLAATKDGLKTLAITGSRRGEGRTTLALCLARAAAAAGIQVALVDADFARPQLAARLGLEVAYGWQDAALGKIPLAEAAVKSLADRITALPLETSAAGAALSLSDPRVTATLRAAAATFELVILDLGPLSGGHEPLFPPGEGCPLDATIVVRDMRYASAAESQTVGDRLFAAGVDAVGIAENFVTA